MRLMVRDLCFTSLGLKPAQEPLFGYKVSGSWPVRVYFIGSALPMRALIDINGFPVIFWLFRDPELDYSSSFAFLTFWPT